MGDCPRKDAGRDENGKLTCHGNCTKKQEGKSMIDKMIVYLWFFMSIMLIIAAAEKTSCLNL